MYSKYRKIRERRRQGFTLVEVMAVLVILVVLAGISVTAIQGIMSQANKREAEIFVKSLDGPLELFLTNHGSYPTTSQGLDALLNPPEGVDVSKGEWPYIKDSAVKLDPWNNPYQYAYPSSRNSNGYDLWSMGPDRVSGTDDDIGNWK